MAIIRIERRFRSVHSFISIQRHAFHLTEYLAHAWALGIVGQVFAHQAQGVCTAAKTQPPVQANIISGVCASVIGRFLASTFWQSKANIKFSRIEQQSSSRLVLLLKDSESCTVDRGAVHQNPKHFVRGTACSLQCNLFLLLCNKSSVLDQCGICTCKKHNMTVRWFCVCAALNSHDKKTCIAYCVLRIAYCLPARARTFRKMKPPSGLSSSTLMSGVPCNAALRFHPSVQTMMPTALLPW